MAERAACRLSGGGPPGGRFGDLSMLTIHAGRPLAIYQVFSGNAREAMVLDVSGISLRHVLIASHSDWEVRRCRDSPAVAFLTKGECPPTGLSPHTDTLGKFLYLGTPH
jgi:hypothetical protein